jgi:hypothetical protein
MRRPQLDPTHLLMYALLAEAVLLLGAIAGFLQLAHHMHWL